MILLLILPAFIVSCGDDDVSDEGLPTITQVNFSETSYSVEENASGPVTIELVLSKPLEASGSAIIAVDNSSTAGLSDFTTDPAMVDGELVLDMEVGATSATFTMAPVDNEVISDDMTVVFHLSDAKKGLELAKNNLYVTVTIHNDDELQGTISTSVNQLEDFGMYEQGEISPSKSYTVSGTDLIADLEVEAPDNFQLSLDNSTFSSSLTIPKATANGGAVPIYVQFMPNTGIEQNISGSITHSATGTNDIMVSVSGDEVGGVPAVEPIFSDNFDYGSTAGDLTGLSPWENYSGTEQFIQYIPDGLSFSGYAASGGGAFGVANGAGSREDIERPFEAQTSGTVYTAQLVNVGSASSGDFFHALRDNGGSYINRLYAMDDGSGNLLFGTALNRSGSGVEVYATKTFSYNTTYLVVIKYDFTTETTSLFVIDGTIPSNEPQTADAMADTGNKPLALDGILYRQSTDDITATIDGIRVANTWKDVLGI